MPTPAQSGGEERPCVLVIDDNEPTAKAMARVLEKEGYRVVVSLFASDGLNQVEKTSVNAAVVDIHLPDMNGLVVAQKLRDRLGAATPIIVLSGDTSMATLNSLSHVGATYFFSKPLNTALFIERLRQWLKPATADA